MSLVAGWDAAGLRPPDVWRVGLGWWQLCKTHTSMWPAVHIFFALCAQLMHV